MRSGARAGWTKTALFSGSTPASTQPGSSTSFSPPPNHLLFDCVENAPGSSGASSGAGRVEINWAVYDADFLEFERVDFTFFSAQLERVR